MNGTGDDLPTLRGGDSKLGSPSRGAPLSLLPLRPILQERVWGGSRLTNSLNDRDAPVGESWQAADLDGGVSTVASGPFAGATLRQLVEQYGADLVGKCAPLGRFPFLVKVIDAKEMLSVQVHPDQDGARRLPNAASKEETWYFLADGGSVLHGLKSRTDRHHFETMLAEGRVTELLREIHVRRGDLLHVKPGTLHAIGGDVFLLEVQEPSDTTFRVWDYNRKGLDGKPRVLHIQEALSVMSLEEAPPPQATYEASEIQPKVRSRLLVDTSCYRMEELRLGTNRSWRCRLSGDTCVLATLVDGSALFATANEEFYRPAQYESVLLPASMKYVDIRASDDSTLIFVGVGGQRMILPDALS